MFSMGRSNDLTYHVNSLVPEGGSVGCPLSLSVFLNCRLPLGIRGRRSFFRFIGTLKECSFTCSCWNFILIIYAMWISSTLWCSTYTTVVFSIVVSRKYTFVTVPSWSINGLKRPNGIKHLGWCTN